ncbi:MAG: glycolate oxidase subunit GlcF [Gammaproteobacteria bacterium]|nr:glycolate oxidase subunit GlcF [Gammaproteobacteria bacterium]
MQTSLLESIRNTASGREADAILRSCVHCGFCNATCPTYQLLGDELDGPRGRIYLIKQMLEGQPVTTHTQSHLDRCLTCRACETTCPSGVRYARLAEIGKDLVEQQVSRPLTQRLLRRVLLALLPYPQRFAGLLAVARGLRPLLPAVLARKIPRQEVIPTWPARQHTRRMLVLEGCVQRGATPQVNASTARVLDTLGISLLRAPQAGCCGAVSAHLQAHHAALDFMRRNIDAWWPYIEAGAEAIVTTASGCGVVVKDYGAYLRDDPNYSSKAARVSALARDVSEVVAGEDLSKLQKSSNSRIAFHAPCTLQHGQKITGKVENILQRCGYVLTPVANAHLCCGSAGTYSILQAELSQRLLADKLNALQSSAPAIIATANIGCQLHLASQAQVPVKHWIELLDGGLQ